MTNTGGNVARLYLPLLNHAQAEVRRQACVVLLGAHGAHAVTGLRQLLGDPDPEIRLQAQQGLHVLMSIGGIEVAEQPYHAIYVECLGQLRVWVGGRQILPRDWMQPDSGRAGWRKVQGAFAYLVHRGRYGASRKALGEAVWGGPVSAASMARTLTALRQTLAGPDDSALIERTLTISGDQISFAADSYTSDARFFEQAFDIACRTEDEQGLAAAAPLYAQTLRLYSGPYMIDVAGSDEWGQGQRDHLLGSAVIAAERLAEHAYAGQRYRECVAICRQALEIDDTAEELSSWLLRAYDRLNLRREIGMAYRSYLRAATVSPHEGEGRHNPVVRTYQELTGVRDAG
ncbi:MAG TPA: BTAD domain-containing putative transcriptional regulator [Roseiflexaceae bacterium]|nr:BTAD domain-containing putative transcriptional regulator [Roseiflexaceae bacterium]